MKHNLEGAENWEARFRELFFKQPDQPNMSDGIEAGASLALQWLKIYSPLNPDYEKPQDSLTKNSKT
jgi:hypothetical protein